MNCIRM